MNSDKKKIICGGLIICFLRRKKNTKQMKKI